MHTGSQIKKSSNTTFPTITLNTDQSAKNSNQSGIEGAFGGFCGSE
jgi:hypothetical protein